MYHLALCDLFRMPVCMMVVEYVYIAHVISYGETLVQQFFICRKCQDFATVLVKLLFSLLELPSPIRYINQLNDVRILVASNSSDVLHSLAAAESFMRH